MGKRGVRLVIASGIGQVRGMLALTGQPGGARGYYRTVRDAVDSIHTGSGGGQGCGGRG